MEIVKQQEFTYDGNDCLICDVVVMLCVHEIYVVELIRRYHGWCDDGLSVYHREEFRDLTAAEKHYNWIIRGES